jgi:hypothetical protein
MKTNFAVVLALSLLTGCVSYPEPVSLEEAKQPPLLKGAVVHANGISLTVPEVGLLLRTNSPRKGFVTLHNLHAYHDAGSYNVFPFQLKAPTDDPKEAWHRHMQETGHSKFLQKMKIGTQNQTEWNGVPAWYFEAHILPAVKDRSGVTVIKDEGFVMAGISTAPKGGRHYFISRSKALTLPENLSTELAEVRRDFKNFLAGVVAP